MWAVEDPWPTRPYAPRDALSGGSQASPTMPGRTGVRRDGQRALSAASGSSADGEYSDGRYLTPDEEQLFMAVRSGNVKAVEAIIRLGVAVDARDADGCTPLHIAAQKGKDAVLPLLLDAGAPVDAQAQVRTDPGAGLELGRSPVGVLGRSRGYEFAECSTLPGNSLQDAWTPLHLAAFLGREACVSTLLEYGAGIEAQDSNGCTALHKAGANGHLASLNLLLAAGAKPDAVSPVGNTPLHLVRPLRTPGPHSLQRDPSPPVLT